MINKLISIGTLLCLLAIMLMSRADSNDPLFYLISVDSGAATLKLALVAAMLYLAFKNSFSSAFIRNGVALLGLGIIVFGVSGLFVPVLGNILYEYFKPLDLLLLIESGIVFSASALDRQIKPAYRNKQPVKIPVRAATQAISSA